MKFWRIACAIALISTLGVVGHAHAFSRNDIQRTLHAASVLVGSGCSGVLVEGPDLVATAEHCVKGHDSLDVHFSDGATRTGWLVAVDHAADQVLLLLDAPVGVTPLTISRQAPVSGSILYFEGRPSDARFQEAKLDHVGQCPSLPNLPNALFTTIAGVPGDSGAPIVDVGTRVVGLVHGGAQCQIATPSDTLVHLVDHFFDSDELQIPTPPR